LQHILGVDQFLNVKEGRNVLRHIFRLADTYKEMVKRHQPPLDVLKVGGLL